MPIKNTSILHYIDLARMRQPIGACLLFWPCLWGVTLSGISFIQWHTLLSMAILFALGSFVMRSAGCVWNDMVDRDIDTHVERTKNRPIASGHISRKQAGIFMVGLCAIGFIILLQFNKATILIGIASLFLIATYPFMKRITWWPQFFLGLTFNWGALMGWTAIRGKLDLPAILLWIAGIFWTLGYDTLYAGQDKKDDKKAGIKSSILRLGNKAPLFLYATYTAFILMLTVAIITTSLYTARALWFMPLLLAITYIMIYQSDLDDPESCLASFKNNNHLGFTIFLILAIPLG